jgi:tetratricopeptide (TPR) repeat protein
VWPADTGHAPSFDNLDKLAQLYECGVADLLVDCPDYRHLDDAHGAEPETPNLPATRHAAGAADSNTITPLIDLLSGEVAIQLGPSLLVPPESATALLLRLQEIDFNELAQVISMWAQRINPNLNRRELLGKLSTAFALAAATPILDVANPDERQRVARVLDDPSRLDLATLVHTEEILQRCRLQGDVLGPRVALQTALAQRHLMDTIAKDAPDALRPRALSVHAQLSQLVGWLLFNLGDYRNARHYYDDARTTAHDAQDADLVTYVLCTMSHLATWQDKPRVGIDHAIAASAWAEQTGNPRTRAYAADVAARAYAADHQAGRCNQALDHEYAMLDTVNPDEPVSSWWYFHDQSFYWATKSGCALQLGSPEAALEAVTTSLGMFDPANLHNFAFTLLFRGEAYIQQGEITEACKTIGDVASLTAVNTSKRIDQHISQLRGTLGPWAQTKPVQELDDRLVAYRRSASGSGRT